MYAYFFVGGGRQDERQLVVHKQNGTEMVNDSSTHFLLSKNLLWMGFIFLVKKSMHINSPSLVCSWEKTK